MIVKNEKFQKIGIVGVLRAQKMFSNKGFIIFKRTGFATPFHEAIDKLIRGREAETTTFPIF